MVTSSAVVGSSAISKAGSLASAMAIITRCRWPPDNWCGSASNRSAAGKPQDCSSASIRDRLGRLPCSDSASPTWRPMRCRGFRLVIGSWKIIPATRPRILRSASSDAVTMLVPSNATCPVGAEPGGSSRRIANAVSDLPDPLSPTSASVSPRSSVNDTPSTTAFAPKRIVRS